MMLTSHVCKLSGYGGKSVNKQIVIGVTGSFGSGCTTISEVLTEDFGFIRYSLSDTLKEKWSDGGKEKSVETALRHELQDLGNQLRREKSHGFLAEETFSKVVKDGKRKENLIFDSIRNTAEITFFRAEFPNFYVIAVDCTEGDRWERVREKYEKKNMAYADFSRDDQRDKNEEGIPYGQQVALCVDEADYLVRNDNDPMITTETAIKRTLSDKLYDPINLFKGELRPPTPQEAYMSTAYSASLMSQCIKRQVGAVIVDKLGAVVSIGYNENPMPIKPCYLQFGDCYREIVAENVMGTVKNCPFCNKQLDGLSYPYVCPHCGENIYRKIVRDRAISRCTALHAEERAIINAPRIDLNDSTLYVTTFPCFNCAQKILDAGIETVYYVESYPDVDSIHLFELSKKMGGTIRILKFEGVKARAYFKLFDGWRKRKEAEMLQRRVRKLP